MKVSDGVFVVSGATSGLGAQTARALVEEGGRVILADIDELGGKALAAELGGNARFHKTDVSITETCAACIEAALAEFGHLHGLVNCAGIAPPSKILSSRGPHDLALFERVLDINLVGTFDMIRLAVCAIAKQNPAANGERGVIINTASIAAYEGMIGQAAYSASKAGVAGMTLPLARELAAHGIRVACIAPGIFRTAMTQGFSDHVRDALDTSVPFPKRCGEPAEFSMLVKHIIENSYLNGVVIRLDGALRMGA